MRWLLPQVMRSLLPQPASTMDSESHTLRRRMHHTRYSLSPPRRWTRSRSESPTLRRRMHHTRAMRRRRGIATGRYLHLSQPASTRRRQPRRLPSLAPTRAVRLSTRTGTVHNGTRSEGRESSEQSSEEYEEYASSDDEESSDDGDEHNWHVPLACQLRYRRRRSLGRRSHPSLGRHRPRRLPPSHPPLRQLRHAASSGEMREAVTLRAASMMTELLASATSATSLTSSMRAAPMCSTLSARQWVAKSTMSGRSASPTRRHSSARQSHLSALAGHAVHSFHAKRSAAWPDLADLLVCFSCPSQEPMPEYASGWTMVMPSYLSTLHLVSQTDALYTESPLGRLHRPVAHIERMRLFSVQYAPPTLGQPQ